MYQELINYIQKEKQAGKLDAEIKKELLSAGWRKKDIDDAFMGIVSDSNSDDIGVEKVRINPVPKDKITILAFVFGLPILIIPIVLLLLFGPVRDEVFLNGFFLISPIVIPIYFIFVAIFFLRKPQYNPHGFRFPIIFALFWFIYALTAAIIIFNKTSFIDGWDAVGTAVFLIIFSAALFVWLFIIIPLTGFFVQKFYRKRLLAEKYLISEPTLSNYIKVMMFVVGLLILFILIFVGPVILNIALSVFSDIFHQSRNYSPPDKSLVRVLSKIPFGPAYQDRQIQDQDFVEEKRGVYQPNEDLIENWKVQKIKGFQIQYPKQYFDLKNIRPTIRTLGGKEIASLFSLEAGSDISTKPGFQINVFPLEFYGFRDAPGGVEYLYDLSADRWWKDHIIEGRSPADLRSFVIGDKVVYELSSGDAGHGTIAAVIPIKEKNVMLEIVYFTDPFTEINPPVKDIISTLAIDKETDFYSLAEDESEYRYIAISNFSLRESGRFVEVFGPVRHGSSFYIQWESDPNDYELPISINLVNSRGSVFGSIIDSYNAGYTRYAGEFINIGTHRDESSYDFIAPPGDDYMIEVRLFDEENNLITIDRTLPFSLTD